MQNPDSGDDASKTIPQRNYGFLSSTNLIYRDQLPPEYSLPTLVGGHPQDFRGLNTIDNEEQIPEIDFRDALAKFEVNPDDTHNDEGSELDIDNDNEDDNAVGNDDNDHHHGNFTHRCLRKTYSENELSKYDHQSGRRKSQCQQRTVIFNWEPDYNHEYNKTILANKERFRDGIYDEYIPNFNTFNLAKFGIDESALTDSEDDEPVRGRTRHRETVPDKPEEISPTQTSTQPIEIKKTQDIKRNGDSFEVSDESFRIAASPERQGDRQVLSSIPKNFSSLSFTYRRKMLTELLPESLRDNTDYKNHIAKIIRKNSVSASSLSSAASNIFVSQRKPKRVDPDLNELGSILLNKWRLGRVFNNGGFGIIRECFNVDDADDVRAVKVISLKHSAKCLQNFQSEIIMWSRLKHEYIVPLYDVRVTTDYIFLLMPLYDEGSLFDRVKFWETNKIELVERLEVIVSYLKCIAKALTYLHENQIHHGDIKLENFLLENNIPQLCDFGMTNYDKDCTPNTSGNDNPKIIKEIQSAYLLLSKDDSSDAASTVSQSNKVVGPMSGVSDAVKPNDTKNPPNTYDFEKEHHINIGSLPYAAPELLQPCPTLVDCQADIWALGILAYALVVLKLPFWHIYEPRLKLSILEGNWKTTEWLSELEQHQQLSILHQLLQGCLTDRESRFTISDVTNLLNTQ